MGMIDRRALTRGLGAAGALAGIGMPSVLRAQGTGWAKLRGQTIVVNWPAHPHYAVAKQLLPEFTAATGIKVEVDEMQYLRLKDAQVLQMGKPKGDYDVCVYVIMWKTEYVQRKFLVELEPMFQNADLAMPGYDRDDIIKGYYEGLGLVGGPRGYLPGPGAKLYGLPYGAECSVLAYRKDLFAKHNLEAPKTYDDMLKAARIMKEKEGIGGLTQRAQAGHQVTTGRLNHLTPYDGLIIDDKFNAVVDQPNAIKAVEVYKEFIDTGPAGGAAFDFGQMLNAFLQGQAAMYCDTISIFGPAADPTKSKVVDTIGYAVHPKAAKYSSELGGFGMAIPQNSEKKEAAFAFMQWMTAKAQDVKASAMGGQPMRRSTLEHPDVVKKYPQIPVYKQCLEISNPDWRPIINEWTEISEKVLGVTLSEIITGKTAIKPGMAEANTKIAAILERGGYKKG